MLVVLMVAVYSIVFSFLTIMRMYSLNSNAWDLGNYNQALYTFDFNGKLFYWTPELIANPSGSLFGIHFSPLFFLLAPPYLVYPRPETLLVLQSIGLAIGALPAYWLAIRLLRSTKLAFLFALCYLANPVLMGVNWFDFHPEAFVPASMLFVIYFFLDQKWVKLALSSLFALSALGEVGFLVAALGASFLIRQRPWIRARLRENRVKILASLSMVFAGLGWAVLSISVTLFFNPNAPFVKSASPFWSVLGASNLLNVPVAVVLNPVRALNAFAFGGVTKALFLVLVLGSFGFLALRAPWVLLPSLVWLGPALLSNYPVYYLLGYQYPALALPFVVYASMDGARRFGKILTPKRVSAWLLGWIIIALTLSNPILSIEVSTAHTWVSYGVPNISPRDQVAFKFTQMIPADASVLADSFIFPLVSSRLNAFTLPPNIPYPTVSFLAYIDQIVGKVNYIILDLYKTPGDPRNALVLTTTRSDFGVVGFSDGIVLLQRGYQSEPVLFDPVSVTYNYQNLTLQDGSVVHDPDSSSGQVFTRTGSGLTSPVFWSGPFTILPPGKYEVHYMLKTGSATNGTLLTLDAAASRITAKGAIYDADVGDPHWVFYPDTSSVLKVVLNATVLTGKMLRPNTFQEFSLEVVADSWGLYEFRGLNAQSNVTLSLDRIQVREVVPLSYYGPIRVSFAGYSFDYDALHSEHVYTISSLLPAGKSLLMQGDLSALLIRQGTTYLVPPPCCSPNNWTIPGSLDTEIGSVIYIMVDSKTNATTATLVLSNPLVKQNFGVLASADGVMLLQRNY